MRRRFTLDLAVNALLALTCVVVLSKYGYDWWQATHLRPGGAMRTLPPGTKIPELTGIPNDRSLVIFASTSCRFCTSSMPFYRELSQRAHDAGLRLVAVGNEPRDALAAYFRSHSVTLDDVLSASPESLRVVVATPTLAIVDKAGLVRQAWVGRLSADAEAQVRAAVAAR